MSVCLITRAQPGADASVRAFHSRGIHGLAIPAARIVATDATVDTNGVQALLMTSAAAARSVTLTPDLLRVPVYAVGDATAATASEMGFETVVSAGGDGATLAVLAADRLRPENGALLHVRGQEVAGDVTGMLSACGFETRAIEVYQTQDNPDFRDAFLDLLRTTRGAVIIYSPAGARRVAAALRHYDVPFGDWQVFGLSLACQTALEPFPFAQRFTAERPDENALIDIIERQFKA